MARKLMNPTEGDLQRRREAYRIEMASLERSLRKYQSSAQEERRRGRLSRLKELVLPRLEEALARFASEREASMRTIAFPQPSTAV